MRFNNFALLVAFATLIIFFDGASSSDLQHSKIEHTHALLSSNVVPTKRLLRGADEERATGNAGIVTVVADLIKWNYQHLLRNRKVAALIKKNASFDEMYKAGVRPSQYFDGLHLSKLFDSKAKAHAAKFGDLIEDITDSRYILFKDYKKFTQEKLRNGIRYGQA
ncbi:putative RxLR effector [Phytophthora palmivora]|uniref:RxLR effector protein n=1 Tax=Phytophthora palmivora TaxID=4796 RepID=A0A2P4X6D2_9STRA|nr:putative RxLR effector [Phytophthora palmivora]